MIARILGWLIGTRTGLFVLLGLSALLVLGVAALAIWHSAYAAGGAVVAAAAAAEGLRRTAMAQKARTSVQPNDQEAMRHDPFNRARDR